MVKAAELANSLKEAKALVANGSVSVNNAIAVVGAHYSRDEILPDIGGFKIQVGKKRVRNLKPE